MTDQELATGETLSAWEDANEALAAHDAEQAAIPADAGEERMAFEAALFDLYEFAPDRPSFGRYQDGDYRDTRTHKFWRVWQARAALAQRQPLTEWQPIETAPKDGTRLILSDGKFVGAGVWVGRYFAWGVSPEPTHWMPLPAAPGATTGEQR